MSAAGEEQEIYSESVRVSPGGWGRAGPQITTASPGQRTTHTCLWASGKGQSYSGRAWGVSEGCTYAAGERRQLVPQAAPSRRLDRSSIALPWAPRPAD